MKNIVSKLVVIAALTLAAGSAAADDWDHAQEDRYPDREPHSSDADRVERPDEDPPGSVRYCGEGPCGGAYDSGSEPRFGEGTAY